ncbi:F-box protein at5g49610 [Phtheirospermum japonicum]|uniref:F-box protein at5g49610 n=1 Tax=Phtheirospermum japonicum TaxID=374723 RepID=A0A830CN20_9LAMI|nr:F-box protein at5g49610 [Phtheirospermum japonicum]
MDTHSNTVSSIDEENKSEMVGGNCYLGRCERKMLETNLDSLPDDILFFNILTRLPAQDIYNAPRVVCRKWYQMIHTHNFVYAHLHHSPCELLIQSFSDYTVTFMGMTRGQIEISKFSFNSSYRIWSSCNGLVLEPNFGDNYDLSITNLVTKQHFVLPPFFARTQHPNSLSAIAYAAATTQYKVVRTCYLEIGNPCSRKFCAVLTVGVDNSWRLVDTQHLSLTTAEHFSSCPLVTGGFVHWARGGSYVLTLDVETEIITQIPVPQCNCERFGNAYCYYYFSAISYLSLLTARSNFKWDVWEMKPETREWTKLPGIDLEDQKYAFIQLCYKHDSSFKFDGGSFGCLLHPAGWLKYREVLVFIVFKRVGVSTYDQSRLRIAYNFQTQAIYLFELETNGYPYLVHRNSLLWLDGC